MIVKLLTKTNQSFQEAAEAGPSLHMSKCHIVGNLMLWLKGFCYVLMLESLCLYHSFLL